MNMPGFLVVLLLLEMLGHLVMKTGISFDKYSFSSKRYYGNDSTELFRSAHKRCFIVRKWKQVHGQWQLIEKCVSFTLRMKKMLDYERLEC